MYIPMRFPTTKEYNLLRRVTNEENEKMHWEDMYTFIRKPKELSAASEIPPIPDFLEIARGGMEAGYWITCTHEDQSLSVGFRPTISTVSLPHLNGTELNIGDSVVMGTLYMDGNPVKVPTNPTATGDMTAYQRGSRLALRYDCDDPSYQITGIYVGRSRIVADRCILNNISYADLERLNLVKRMLDYPTTVDATRISEKSAPASHSAQRTMSATATIPAKIDNQNSTQAAPTGASQPTIECQMQMDEFGRFTVPEMLKSAMCGDGNATPEFTLSVVEVNGTKSFVMTPVAKYRFNVSWQMTGTVEVVAGSREEAMQKIKQGMPPVAGQYTNGSLTIVD